MLVSFYFVTGSSLLYILALSLFFCLFSQYASVVKDGEHFMTHTDFLIRFLGIMPEQNYSVETVKLLANVIDTTKDGFVICL